MRSLLVVMVGLVGCAADSTSTSGSLEIAVVPEGEHAVESSEMTALAAGIVASHQLSLEH